MTVVVSSHNSELGLPMGGPVLRPGARTEVANWDRLRNHNVVAAWLRAGILTEIDAMPEPGQAIDTPIDEPAADVRPLDTPDFDNMDREALKAYLDTTGVDYSPRVGTGALVAYAKSAHARG